MDNESIIESTKTQIYSYDADQVKTLITQLETKDLNFKSDSNTLFIAFRIYYPHLEGFPEIQIQQLSENYQRKRRLMSELKFHAKELGIANEVSADYENNEFGILHRIERLIQQYDDSYEHIFRHARMMERINTPHIVPVRLDEDKSLYRYSTEEDDEKKTAWQELLLYLLHELNLLRYKRYKDSCFMEIRTAEGKSTRAWKPVVEIAEFVQTKTQKECKYDMWKNLTSKGSCLRDTIEHLTKTIDIQFPDIKKNRHVWSFRNGLFHGKYETKDTVEARFIPYDSQEYDRLDPTIVSSKYFDQDFDNYDGDWYDIPTPFMQSVLEYQRFDEDVSRWLYAFCGRLCYDVNEMDGWQVIPFLKGIAGSGKSTIITKVCKKFYDADDVKTLSNNIEKKFGLSTIYDSFMFISPEIKKDVALEQAEFQSLVSGEDMSIARKNQTAKSITWKVPGILAGNEMPGWRDNSGSILRRIVTWNFGRQVQDADPQLEQKLETELPLILQKCVKAYVEYSTKYKSTDIWRVLPQYFHTIRTQVAMVTSPLQNFLCSEKVVYGPDLFVPQKYFVHVFNEHCQANNLGRLQFNPDFYAGPFSSRDIEVRNEHQVTYNGRVWRNQPIIYGLDITNGEAGVAETLAD